MGDTASINRDVAAAALDSFFGVRALGPDPAMSRFIPTAYDPIGIDWRTRFTASFVEYFNGLMLAGRENIGNVYCSVFPTPEVLEAFIAQAAPGDLLFLHHPIDFECGDPRGAWGRGLQPIDPATLDALEERHLSVYTCHAPMDIHGQIGTTAAMVAVLDGDVSGAFASYASGSVGVVCAIAPTDTTTLIEHLKAIYRIPYVDFEGRQRDDITRVAVIAGAGDKVAWFREAEALGAQAYVTGEIHHHIDNDYGRMRFAQVIEYAKETSLSLIGVSHAASEYLVMETQMAPWLRATFGVRVITLPLSRWWR